MQIEERLSHGSITRNFFCSQGEHTEKSESREEDDKISGFSSVRRLFNILVEFLSRTLFAQELLAAGAFTAILRQ